MEVLCETAAAVAAKAPVSGGAVNVQGLDMALSDKSEIMAYSGPPPVSITTILPSRCVGEEALLTPIAIPEEKEIVKLPEDYIEYIPVGVLKLRDINTGQSLEVDVARLEAAKWVRTAKVKNDAYPGWISLRIFVLPDDVCRGSVPRGNTSLRKALKHIMSKVDGSAESWEGNFNPEAPMNTTPTEQEESLFYIFNTLESPSPDVGRVSDPHSCKAMKEALSAGKGGAGIYDEDNGLVGLKTSLYAYQSQSAAFMIQRESQPGETLDPRLQPHITPTGREYYYDKEDGSIVQEKRLYSEPCGGILAETMGYGKTLICLAVILATKGHFPRIPSEYIADTRPVRKQTASLVDMAAAAAGRFSVPWGAHFERLEKTGIHYERCRAACERNRGSYTIPAPLQRYKSRAGASSRIISRQLLLSSGTLVVVPMNLIDHWRHEIKKHTQGLKILVLRDSKDRTPPSEDLLQYDIIIFARARFDREATGNELDRFIKEKEKWESPLTKIHWLRILVDEGHSFAGHGQKTNSIHMLELLHVERRWVVSGTPSSGLYGVEVNLASQDTGLDVGPGINGMDLINSRRQVGGLLDEELKDLDKLRLIIVEFLNAKPWSNARSEDPAEWKKYMKPIGADGKRGKAPYLRSTLQSLVVRHRLGDIDNDITLPKLHNKVVHLSPTSYDRMSINLFIFILTVNAVTSERTGEDYMFHPKNRKHLSVLISNLRHAGFWYTGFRGADIKPAIDHANEYLERNKDRITSFDRELLSHGIAIAETALNSNFWHSFSKLDELGIFLEDFPEHARSMWTLDSGNDLSQGPLLMGISQARRAQKFVTSRLRHADPAEGIAGAGIKAWKDMQETRTTNPGGSDTSKKSVENLNHRPKPEVVSPTKSTKKSFSKGYFKSLPEESALSKTKFVATASAKLTYLLQKVLDFHIEEKIIIFYENNNFAFWIAEGLETLGIEFRIYSNTLKPAQRSKYLAQFNESDKIRVLLMDLGQAAHGLHIACASRIFIVNPIWRPTIESQAIKRAHRISQNRPVYVETLVLEGTFEDKMLRRRKQMSNAELHHAEKDLLDDSTMNFIVKNMGFLKTPAGENSPQPAYLKEPPGFFDRHTLPVPDDHDDAPSKAKQQPTPPARGTKRKSAKFDIPLAQSEIGSSSSGENEHKRKRVKILEFAESDGSGVNSDKNSMFTPPESATLQTPSPGFSESKTRNSEVEIGGTEPLTPTFSMASSLFGGPCPSPGSGL